MKKTTLLLCLFMASVMMPQLALSETTVSLENGVLTITSTEAGKLSGNSEISNLNKETVTTIVLVGTFSSSDLEVINQNNGFNQVTTVDMSNAMFESNNGTSNLYFMYNSGAPSHNSPTVGSKALSGGQLYQLSVTTAKSWNPTTEPASLNDAQYFNDENTLLNSAGGYSQGKIGYCPSGEYRYYMMNVNKYWDAATDPGNVQNYANQYDTDNLPPTDYCDVNNYVKVPSAFNYYKMQITKQWNPIDNSYSYNEVDWEENDRAQHLGYELGTCIRFAHYNYEYYKVFKGNDNNNQYVCLLNKLSDYTPTRSEQSYNTYQDAENDKWNRQNDEVVLVKNETFSYYQIVETREWITPVGDTTGATVPSFGENERDNNKVGFENGAVIKFPTAYSIYQLKETRQWTGPTSTPNSNTVGNVTDAQFLESEINNYTANWGDKNSIRFPIYSYYVLTETQNRSWVEKTYNDDDAQTIYHLFVDINARDNDNTAQNDEYAMVGATEYVYKSSGWSTDLTPEPDYSAIRFRHWSGTLTTAYLPNSVDGASCPVEVLQECSHLTKLYSNNQYAEVSVSGTTATVTAQSPGLLKTLLTPTLNATNYPANTVFQFTSGSELNADDIYALSADPAMYYVDLYDISTGSGSTIERAIAKIQEEGELDEDYAARPLGAIDRMRADNKQFKGLLLPRNPLYVGTTLIKDNEQNSDSRATCTEFVAYNNNTSTGMYIYSESTDNPDPTCEGRLNKVLSMMAVHSVAGATTSYFVSTNSPSLIPNVSTKLGSGKTIIETVNNEMVKVATNPSIYVTLANPGDFKSLVENTSIEETPNVQTLQFNGELCFADINAVNSFAAAGGPKVFDLKNATVSEECPYTLTEILVGLDDNDAVNGLAYTGIDYIILPAGMSKENVNSIGPKAVKAVISSNVSSDEDHNLVAYVNVPGSLAEARCLATGSSNANGFYPAVQGLKKVILAGNLNADDIGANEDGQAFKGEKATVTSINLEKAYFANASDMVLGNGNFSGNANETNLKVVKLPTNENMTEIPANCLNGISTLTDLHIPYNYKKIGWQAFWETGINHITTEDANHVLIDNGEHTYTLSANIEELGEAGHIESTAVFPQKQKVHDVYCLATKVPTCYAHTFHADIVYGHGGANEGPYCKEKYHGDEKVIALLHFPCEDSYNSDKNKDKESTYADLEKKYTNPTRAYTKKDQTGAVDANGNPMCWPDQSELLTSRTMAIDGYIWTDYDYNYPPDGHLESATLKSDAVKNGNFAAEFAGWHEFILSQATHVDPTEIVTEEKVIERKYVDAGWYTICIPYNLTRSQVLKMMGVPASTAKVKNYLGSKNAETNETTYTEVEEDMMPNIRQLQAVIRKKKGVDDTENQVRIRLTTNLYNDETQHTSYLDFTEVDGNKTSIATVDADGADGKKNSTDPICLVGGRPYVIKVYKREGEKISQQNIGKYILTRYGDELGLSASCLNNGNDYFEQLKTTSQEALQTMHFAKPYEKHLVQALADDGNATPITYTEGTGVDAKTYRYYYTFQGQFWDQDMPEYCFYMAKGTWYHYMNTSYNYIWNAYKCVIMATPLEVVAKEPVVPVNAEKVIEHQKITPNIMVVENPEVKNTTVIDEIRKGTAGALDWNEHWGVGSRWYPFCWFPQAQTGTEDLLKSDFRLGFMGRNDDDFNIRGMSRYIFEFDDEIVVEYDEEGNQTTAIDTLDGTRQQVSKSDRVYSISGQYMGTSTDNLPKGIYIIGGRKIVVD